MRHTMMPLPERPETPLDEVLDVPSATLDALGITDHDLFADELDGESLEELAARRAAAQDILDDRLTEIAHTAVTPETIRGWSA